MTHTKNAAKQGMKIPLLSDLAVSSVDFLHNISEDDVLISSVLCALSQIVSPKAVLPYTIVISVEGHGDTEVTRLFT